MSSGGKEMREEKVKNVNEEWKEPFWPDIYEAFLICVLTLVNQSSICIALFKTKGKH